MKLFVGLLLSWSSLPSSRAAFVNHRIAQQQQQHRHVEAPTRQIYATTSSSSNSEKVVTTSSTQQDYVDSFQIERRIVQLGKRGKTDQALDLYFSIEKPTIRILNGAIDACARARPPRLKQAFSLLEQTTHMAPNVFTFGALMSACSRAKRADKALELLQSMQDDYGVMPNAVVYSTAISACARTDEPMYEQALQLLKEAPSDMSVVGYNAALSACAVVGQWEPAMELLRSMESNSTSVKPDQVSYGTVLAACERAQQWRLIMSQAKEIQPNMDAMALTSVLHACQQLGLAQEALEYLELMKNATTPNPRKTAGWQRMGVKSPLRGADAVAYRLAISACARGGKWKEGIQLLEEMRDATHLDETNKDNNVDVVAYTSAITGCEYAGEWKRAFGLVDSMRKDGVEPNVVTFSAVIGACATAISNAQRQNNGKQSPPSSEDIQVPKDKALQLLRIMKKDPTVVDPNVVVYNAAIRVCAEAMDLDRALEFLEELEQDGLEPTIVTFGSLMTACERVGDVDGASKVFRRMKEYANLVPNEIIYGAAISCCRKAGQADRCLLLLRKMIREGLKPNAATFNTVVVAQTESRNTDSMERAILVYKLMKSDKYATAKARPNRQTYNLLIRALAANEQPVQAEAFLRMMQGDEFVPDVDLYTATVTAYERSGQPLKALSLMESMNRDGYDFYESKVLNAAFKKAIQITNAVGRGLGEAKGGSSNLTVASPELVDEAEDAAFQLELQEDDESFINGTATT